jgi:hypothetical protein
MTETVRVRVADALVGRLPRVCCMTGAPADGFAPIVVPKRLGVAWLLLLAGPFGVAVLIAVWPKIRVRYLVRVPMSAAVFERMHTARVRRLWCGWLGGLGLLVAFAVKWYPPLAVVVLVASAWSIAVAVKAHFVLPWTMPSATADAGGRWVILRGVHPAFAAAVADRR